jgi:hypothetical protein
MSTRAESVERSLYNVGSEDYVVELMIALKTSRGTNIVE